MPQETIKLNLKKNSIPIELGGDDGEPIVKLVMHEMSAAKRDAYLDTLTGRTRYEAGKAVGIKKFDGMQADLIVACVTKEDGTPITVKEVQQWPSSVVSQLYDKAQELNHLGETKKEQSEKND